MSRCRFADARSRSWNALSFRRASMCPAIASLTACCTGTLSTSATVASSSARGAGSLNVNYFVSVGLGMVSPLSISWYLDTIARRSVSASVPDALTVIV